MFNGTTKSLLAATSAVAAVGVGVAQARTPHATARATTSPTPLTITVSRARETSTRYRTITIAGRISPTASLKGGAGSIILYRETSAGPQQLSFNGPQTHPKANGTFSIKSTGEPTGHNTYVVQYVPSATGYAPQALATERITVSG